MTDGGAEAARADFFIGPGDDIIYGFAFHHLATHRQRVGVEEVDVVVELFFDGRPIRHSRGNRVLFIDEGDGDGFLRSVRGGLQAEVFEPAIFPCAEAVHGAVQMQ